MIRSGPERLFSLFTSFIFLAMKYVLPCAPLLLASLLACVAGPCAHAYEVELSAPTPLKDVLTEHLDLFRYRHREDINADQLNFMIATVAEQVAQLASTEGYFSPVTTVAAKRVDETTVVRIVVNPGPRTQVSDVRVAVTGAAHSQSPAQADEVRQRGSLRPGHVFRQEDWSAAKEGGLQILQQRRYPAARIAHSEARVLADEHAAELAVEYDSGPLFTLGAPKVSGTERYPASIIDNVNPLVLGEEYSTERLLEFQRQILRTPYFSNVVMDIDRDASHANLAPVHVQVTEYPTQRIRSGAGYTTDTGFHLDGLYSHNNLFGRAWVLDAQADLNERRQFGSLQLALPPGPGAFVDSLHGSFERTALEGIDLRSQRVGLRRARTSDRRDTVFSIESYHDRLAQLDDAMPPPDTFVQPGSHQALVAGIEENRRQVDDLVYPRQGRVLSMQAGVALKGVLSDQSFVRLYGQLREYLPVGKRDVVILRMELGSVLAENGSTAIPASLLFRAGGTESVRGYGYQSIGNLRGGTVYPTRYLATGSAEYQHWLSARWGGAVFYDVGMASDTWPDKSVFHAIGAGVRWRSPVGTVRVDLAYGFQGKQIRPHLSLGVAF